MEEYITFYDLKNNLILNTYQDFKLLIQELTISEASIKEEIEEIPGSDEVLDYTECLTGDVHYNRRSINIILNGPKKQKEFLNVYSKIQDLLHGRRLKLVLSEEPCFYWVGKVLIKDINPYNIIRNIILEIIVEPYKYDIQTSKDDWLWDPFSFEDGIINECKNIEINGEKEITVYGRRKHIIPFFYVEGQISVVYNNNLYELAEGKNEVLDIEIVEGINRLEFIGIGKVSVEYRGGSL